MRIALLISFGLSFGVAVLAQAPAQTPPKTTTPAAPAPATPAPAQRPPAAAPAPRRPAAPSAAVTARTGVAITVTDPKGAPLSEIRVTMTGPSDRSGTTDSMGQLRVTGLQMGTYRLRFAGDSVITFEREVAIRAGQTSDIDVTLTAAPPPPPPPPAPAPPPVAAAPALGPKGEPLIQSVPDVIEKNFIGNQMRRETLLSCSGSTRATLIQLNGPLPPRMYDNADVTYYVIGGEGAVTLAGKEQTLALNDSVSVPRGTLHSFVRRGRRTFILLAVVGGEACEQAK
jgi:hypothetical protein